MFDMIYFVNDIKPGMMISTRDGSRYIIALNSENRLIMRDIYDNSRVGYLSSYDNLSFKHVAFHEHDIMQVFEAPIYCDNHELCDRPHLVSPIIWERLKDEKNDKEERINEIFKEIGKLVDEYEKLRG
jgi:hypothetical protein